MPYIPHSQADVRAMLAAIGRSDMADLFAEIPSQLHFQGEMKAVGEGMSEMALARHMGERASRDAPLLNFIGAGSYEHHIPAPVWEIAGRGEFLTAYTPYQAEASQGLLQVLYEYQTMMARLTAMDASNASLYDGASALGEAILMAVRGNPKKPKRILLPTSLHPRFRQVARTLTWHQEIELVEVPFSPSGGHMEVERLSALAGEGFAALVVAQPNFFGVLEEVGALTDWAHAQGALVIAAVEPVSLALLVPPGEWGGRGADIAVGEGQPLGMPLSSGGPYFGFMTTRTPLLRQMPGRVVGRTVDKEGKPGFTLTLQTREQHIRRSRATSNICTNQGLMATAAAIHMTIMGPDGLRQAALDGHARACQLVSAARRLPGVAPRFDRPFFQEVLLTLPGRVAPVLEKMRAMGVLGGYPAGKDYPSLDPVLLVAVTETKTAGDVSRFVDSLEAAL